MEKPSMTVKPSRPVTERVRETKGDDAMPKLSEITVDISADTDNLVAKLKAISKHTQALAKELEGIDNAWKCEHCGHDECQSLYFNNELYHSMCLKCLKIKE